jgi:hypothetical protein
MPWIESASASFRARHESAHAEEAARLLSGLEVARERLGHYFSRTRSGVTVVLHRNALSLSMARPLLPLQWMAVSPAARRYVAGWAGRDELHVLSGDALAARASNVRGSREMLQLTAPALYARQVVVENNRDLPQPLRPGRIAVELRWGWLLEGAARWFSGQTDYARPAIARRLRDGDAPAFPPGARDAPLLGGTVIDLLAREEGPLAAAQLACRLHPRGPRAALAEAFPGRPLVQTERAWRSHLARLVRAAEVGGASVADRGDEPDGASVAEHGHEPYDQRADRKRD